MFELLQPAPPDPILGLNDAFRQDANPDKINLSVGVYKDGRGATPTLNCVVEAERRLLAASERNDKSYLPIDGLADYGRHVRELLFDGELDESRLATSQTPGGTAALRVAGEFLARASGVSRIWCSRPTWANHPSVFNAAGLAVEQYDYVNESATALDAERMLAAMDQMPAGDAVLLHACCHNPTGIDPSLEQWTAIGEAAARRRLIPLVDIAYQGFGDSVAEDVAGLRSLARHCPELLICSSFSKNFGLYGERVGALTVMAANGAAAQAAQSHVKACIRANYSNPPKHGAAAVALILSDAALRGQWLEELAAMRGRINQMRTRFVESMAAAAPGRDFEFISQQRGMFSNSGLNRMQVDRLRSEFSIYIVGSGRINVAGMTEDNLPRLCESIAKVL